jgi:CheY-like chemotaxis protein
MRAAPRRESILVADDDAGVRRAVGSALRKFGFRVLEAASGAEVLLMFMSGYVHEEAVRRRVLHGSAPFLNKPFTVAQLVHRVRRLLAERRR